MFYQDTTTRDNINTDNIKCNCYCCCHQVMEKMVKEIEELRVKESSAVEEQKKLSRVVRLSTSSSSTSSPSSSLPSMSRLDRGMQRKSGLQVANVQWLSDGFDTHQSFSSHALCVQHHLWPLDLNQHHHYHLVVGIIISISFTIFIIIIAINVKTRP